MLVTLCAGEGRGVVGEEGAGKVVVAEPVSDLLPPGDAGSRVGFGQRPEVPCGALAGIGGDRTAGEFPDDLAATPVQPVGIREPDERACIVRPQVDDALVEWASDFGAVAKRFGGDDEAVSVGVGRDRLQSTNERRKIRALLEGGNGGGNVSRDPRAST